MSSIAERIKALEAASNTDSLGVASKHKHSTSASSFHSIELDVAGPSITAETRPPILPPRPEPAPRRTALPAPSRVEPYKVWEGSRSQPTLQQAFPSRSSIASNSRSSVFRLPPLPAAARSRYDALFNRNIQCQQEMTQVTTKKSRATGWRGPSVDLDTFNQNDVDHGSDRLHGSIVATIWSWSTLSRQTLEEIWTESDPEGQGSLDRAAFALGMWRIDEELSKVAKQTRKPARSSLR